MTTTQSTKQSTSTTASRHAAIRATPLATGRVLCRLAGVLLVAAFIAAPVAATCCEVHVIDVKPGAHEVPLEPEGWLVEASSTLTFELLDGPDRGEWNDWVYTPGSDFWESGMDQLSLEVTELGQDRSTVHHVTIVLLAGHVAEEVRADEGFEATGGSIMGLDTAWMVDGDTSNLVITADAITGDYSLRAVLSSEPSTIERTIHGLVGEPGGSDAVEADGVASIDPGGGHGFDTGPSSPISILGLDHEGTRMAAIEVAGSGSEIDLRARLDSASFSCDPCVTPWRRVPPDEVFAFKLRLGASADGHPSPTGRVLQLAIQARDGSFGWIDGLTGTAPSSLPVLDFVFGAAGGAPEAIGVGVALDDLSLTRRLLQPQAGKVLLENFESGSWDGLWSATGPFSVGGSGLEGGDWAAKAEIVRNTDGTGDPVMLTRNDLVAQQSFGASFLLDLGAADLVPGDRFTVFRGARDSNGRAVVDIKVRISGSRHQIRLVTWDAAGVPSRSPWVDLGVDTPIVPLMLRWRPSVSGDDGSVDLWHDKERITLDGLANAGMHIDRVSFGIVSFKHSATGVGGEQNGVVRLDRIIVVP